MSMYFDHARCPSCGAAFDPDKITTVDGKPACPACGAPMKLVDMFGIADAFAEDEPDDLTLDDLVPGDFSSSSQRYEESHPYNRTAGSQTAHSGSHMHRAVSREDKERLYSTSTTPSPAHEPSSDSLPARVPRRGDDGGGSRSAMDVMREMKRRKK